MARSRSSAPARNGLPLFVSVVVPAAIVAALIAAAVVVLVTGAGHRAASKELDARAATVKKAWDGAGRPAKDSDLQRLGQRLNATLRVVRGRHPQPGSTTGKIRHYAFATRNRETLRVALPTKSSSNALSQGLVAGLIVGLAGALLLGAVLAA